MIKPARSGLEEERGTTPARRYAPPRAPAACQIELAEPGDRGSRAAAEPARGACRRAARRLFREARRVRPGPVLERPPHAADPRSHPPRPLDLAGDPDRGRAVSR